MNRPSILAWAIYVAAATMGACGGEDGSSPNVDPGCGVVPDGPGVYLPSDGKQCDRLSSYRMLTLEAGKPVPNTGVVPYDLNTPLFTDYAQKTRMIWMRAGMPGTYKSEGAFDFPVGTMIAKTFAFPADLREPDKNIRVIETRMLTRHSTGWKAVSYIWNDAQTDAVISPLGGSAEVTFVHYNGQETSTTFLVPNVNHCIECHANIDPVTKKKQLDIVGPKAKHLNRSHDYPDGPKNQIVKLAEVGYLQAVPRDTAQIPALAVWDDTAVNLDARARAYLDANCAHCHNPRGTGAGSGLLLDAAEAEPIAYGVCKPPIRGFGGNAIYDIEPGLPDVSGIVFRMNSLVPKTAMPRIGRSVVHGEAVSLIRQWIAAMDGSCGS